MTEQNRKDIKALADSYARNRAVLIEALRKAGLPSSWLIGWDAKLERLVAASRAEDTTP